MVSYNLGHVKGADGKGISSITKISTSGLVDTYKILFTDGTYTTFEVTNGQDGAGGADIVTAWESTLSDEKIPSEKLTKNTIDTKVTGTKVTSWTGSPSDSNIPSEKLVKNSIDEKLSATKVTSWSGTVSDANVPSEKLVKNSLDAKLSATKVTSWSGTVSDSNVPSEKLTKDTLDTKVTGTKVTSWSGTVADTNIPSEKLVKDSLDGKQATLVSGTNIKTINNNSLLGSGNITISGGNTQGTFTELQGLITSASSGDTIILDTDYKNSGNESVIEITKPLTIIGNGHIIDADGKSGIFQITSNGTGCKINGLYLTNGNYSQGGAIDCIGSCTISDCVFTNNSSNSYGGAISLVSTGNKIVNCIFIKNVSESYGGAVYLQYKNNSVSNCIFEGNIGDSQEDNVFSEETGLIIYNCHITTGLYNTANKDDINSEKKVTSWSSTVSNDNVPSEKLVKDTIDDLIGDINDYITG